MMTDRFTEEIDGEPIDKLVRIEKKIERIHLIGFDLDDYKGTLKLAYDQRSKIINSIPDFWLTVFLKHPAFHQLFNVEDRKIFKYLTSLEVELDHLDMYVKTNYSITFNFKPNPYFEDTKLEKTLTFPEEEGTTKITATPIKWKENIQAPADFGFFSWFMLTELEYDVYNIHDEIARLIKDDVWNYALLYFNMEEQEPYEEDGDEDA